MTHVTDADIDRFCRQALPAEALIAFAGHLAACEACRLRTARRRDGAVAEAALREAIGPWDAHVDEAELRAFVDGSATAANRAAVARHLDRCAACTADMRDLQTLASELAPSRSARRGWHYAYALPIAAALILAGGLGILLRTRSSPAPPGAVATHAHDDRTTIPGVDALPPADRRHVLDAIAARRLALPEGLAALQTRPGRLRGSADPDAFHLLAPRGTVVLRNPPTLTWTPLPASDHYVVTVQRSSGDTFSSPAVREPRWTIDRALAPDETYTWQVAASVGGRESLTPRPPEPPAIFRTASLPDQTRLLSLPASPLVRGILFARAGALDDAERELRLIAPTDPDSPLAGLFLEQIRQAR